MKVPFITLAFLLFATSAMAEEAVEQNSKHYGNAPSLHMLRDALKPGLRDPDSLRMNSCTKPVKAKMGWAALCDFRAKNGFGGYEREHKLIIIRNGKTVWVGDPPPDCTDEWNKEHLLACQPGQ